MAKIDARDSALLCRRLSRIMRGNLSALNALQITLGQLQNKNLKRTVAKLISEMKRGESFAEAAYISGSFDPCFIRCVKEAEEKNSLPECLEEFDAFYKEEHHREQIVNGSVWLPLIISLSIVFVLILMIMFVYPHFMAMFRGVDIELPKLTAAVLSVAEALRNYWEIFILSILVLVILLHLFNNSSFGRRFVSRLVMDGGAFGNIRRLALYSKCAKLLVLLKNENIPDAEALGILADSFEKDLFFSEILYKASETCTEGRRLSEVLREGAFPESFIELLALGEELGDVKGYLNDSAVFFMEEAERKAERRLGIWEPLIIIFTALILIIVIAALSSPIVSLFDSVSSI
ncbi:MAG: type II secretion system F family protein [Lachnospiraceae bacterium]|nr:type II secretion system F family protein [Lachnospiraceae bacterium]